MWHKTGFGLFEAWGFVETKLQGDVSWLERVVPEREVRFVIYVAVIMSFVAIGFWILNRLRGQVFGNQPESIDHLTEFEDLRSRGAFNDQEMSRLKQVIRQTLPDQKAANETGKTFRSAELKAESVKKQNTQGSRDSVVSVKPLPGSSEPPTEA
jgi:hypothetical protein